MKVRLRQLTRLVLCLYLPSESNSMSPMETAKILILLNPLITFAIGFSFFKKQNSKKAWTGGPISKPKSHWLAFTVWNWFFLPFFFLLTSEFPSQLVLFFVFHLISWWLRGPLELFMIYKWFNWSPRYGIAHDLFHFFTGLCILVMTFEMSVLNESAMALSAFILSVLILLTTLFETAFAYLFKSTRTKEEEEQNIYFASDDPKWIFINRVTLTCVIISYSFLILISGILIY